MAYIYIDAFVATLPFPLEAADVTLNLEPEDAARIEAAFGFDAAVVPATAGPRFCRLPLFVESGSQRELVFGTHYQYALWIERTAGLTFPEGATVRCAPVAELAAAGHMMPRLGTGSAVDAAPGERALLAPDTTSITLRVPQGAAPRNFVGEDWPCEVVIYNGLTARDVQLTDYNGYPVAFSLAGAATTQSSLALPASCRMAVLTLRKLPWPLRQAVGASGWMVSAEFYA